MSAGESPTNRQSSGFAPSAAKRHMHHVRRRLGRKSVRPLHMVEIRQQPEHFEHQPRGRRALGGGRSLPAAQRRQRLGHPRIRLRQLVPARPVAGAVLIDKAFDLFGRGFRQHVLEQRRQVQPDETAQVVETLPGDSRFRPALPPPPRKCPARNRAGCRQCRRGKREIAASPERKKPGDRTFDPASWLRFFYMLPDLAHAGCGRSPSESPGSRRGALSGRSTCCVWSSESLEPPGASGGSG